MTFAALLNALGNPPVFAWLHHLIDLLERI